MLRGPLQRKYYQMLLIGRARNGSHIKRFQCVSSQGNTA
jgi:hypothetical protein